MFEDPDEEVPLSRATDPKTRAKDKSDEFRMHAELCAVFEGNRKFDARIDAAWDGNLARECQRMVGKLEKGRVAETPVVSDELAPVAAELLDLPHAKKLTTNDYHIHRRPGEVMIARWLEGEEVDSFYTRLQAHFDFAMKMFVEEERQTHGWKQDANTMAFLEALDALKINMAERYLREPIKQHTVYVLSTQTADEMDIQHLCDFIMGIPAAEIVGEASAPPDAPTERDRAWFSKLFSVRGIKEKTERMCFFMYLQKSDDGF